jgi:hypothetical protein
MELGSSCCAASFGNADEPDIMVINLRQEILLASMTQSCMTRVETQWSHSKGLLSTNHKRNNNLKCLVAKRYNSKIMNRL